MDGPTDSRDSAEARRRVARSSTGSTLFEAALYLLVGFVFLGGLSGVSDWGLFNAAVAVTVWAFQIGGLLMLGVAILCWMGCPRALAFDAGVNALIGSVLILASVVWLLAGDLYGLLFLLIGGMSLNSMLRSWRNYRLTGHVSSREHHTELDGDEENRSATRSVEKVRTMLDRRAEEAGSTDRGSEPDRGARFAESETAQRTRPAIRETEETPPEGFLAELGRRDQEDQA